MVVVMGFLWRCFWWQLAALRFEGLDDPSRFFFHCFEPPEIRAKACVGLGAVLKSLEICLQFGRSVCREGVDHPVGMAGGFDHSVFPKVSELLGDFDLRDFQQLLEVAHAEGAVR